MLVKLSMRRDFSFVSRSVLGGLFLLLAGLAVSGQIRDGGIDPRNLGKGDWIYSMTDATNRLGGHVSSVTNETSLMLFYKSVGVRYLVIKAATSDSLFKGCYSGPQFTRALIDIAHAHGILMFGYNRSYGQNVPGEIAISDYVFNEGADGFVWDAEAEWESDNPWIGNNGPSLAWQLCSAVRTNWPNKFLAHAPFPIISYHSSFPYKEFGYWSDTVMPQIYHSGWSGVKGRASGGINWSDVNWANWQKSLYSLAPTIIGGRVVYWTNSIKPLAPLENVYGPLGSSPCEGNNVTPQRDRDVMEFIDYLTADPNSVTAGGYQGASFWRADLHGNAQWGHIAAGTIGSFPGIVNNIVIDNPRARTSGAWSSVRTFYNGSFYGNGTGTDTNSFGTNYLTCPQGSGASQVEFTCNILVPGDYGVYEWHPFRSDASATVPFIIAYNGGAATVYANQQTNSGNWSLLGKFNFAAGPSIIRVTDAIAEPNKVALADGLKLVFVPPDSAPTPPAELSAAAIGTSRIDLSWIDTSTNAAGFVIGRATVSGGPYTDIAVVGPVPTAYSNTGLTDNTTYYYAVRATNSAGLSAYSAEASATTEPRSFVRGIGDNGWGELDVPPFTTNVIAIASGAWHNLALRPDGVVIAWGFDFSGQCDLPPGLSDALAIAAGAYHSLAIRADGSVLAWGANGDGQTNVPAGLGRVVAIGAGAWHSLVLRQDGTVAAWGDNTFGQTNLPAGLTNVIAIAAGGSHNLALRADGSVVGWGKNTDSEGHFAGQATVPWGLSNVIALAAGDYHSLALLRDGRVTAWGDNSQGQCSVPPGLSNVVALAGGGAHSLALRQDGSVVAWGANWNGQCNVPPDFSDVIAVAAGGNHSLVLLAGSLPSPRLLNPGVQGTRFSVLVQSLNRRNYALEYKNSVNAASWTAVSTNAGNGALRVLSDPAATPSRRFYRMKQW